MAKTKYELKMIAIDIVNTKAKKKNTCVSTNIL